MQSLTQFFCVHNIDVKRDKVGMTTKEPESNERWTMSVPFTMGQELTIQSTQSTRIGNYRLHAMLVHKDAE